MVHNNNNNNNNVIIAIIQIIASRVKIQTKQENVGSRLHVNPVIKLFRKLFTSLAAIIQYLRYSVIT